MKRELVGLTLVGAIAAGAAAAWPRRAEACGGCFAPSDAVTAVDSHRMVIALSTERTVLWDQIVYSGNPKDFVWVLPVPTPSATIEVADQQFFVDLDGQTAPIVSPRPPVFADSGSLACGDSEDDAPAPLPPGDDGVTIYDQQVVGPYQTVTIGSEDADALQNWLVQNGYRVTESTVPTIDHYVELGSVFIVMRLAPGEGVQSMEPVRVTYPGYMSTFPLEMVKVGARGTLGMTLWIVSEQRYQAWNYANTVIDPAQLVFDWNTTTSNYGEVFAAAIADAGGRAWVTEFAGPLLGLDLLGPDSAYAREGIPNPYLTRLRTSMLLDYLDEDLVLVPASDASPVSRFLTAGAEIGRPYADEPSGVGCGVAGPKRAQAYLLAAALVFAVERLRRRRGKKLADLHALEKR